MYKSSGSKTARDLFADQFEWVGGDWLYRWKAIGPAYRVTEDEKDAFVCMFDQRSERAVWIAIPVAAAIFTFLFLAAPINPLFFGGGFFAGFLSGFAVRAIVERIAFRAPLEALAGRATVAPPLSKTDRRRIVAERISDGGVIGLLLVGTGLLVALTLTQGWSVEPKVLYLTAYAALCIAWATVDGVRKWVLPKLA